MVPERRDKEFEDLGPLRDAVDAVRRRQPTDEEWEAARRNLRRSLADVPQGGVTPRRRLLLRRPAFLLPASIALVVLAAATERRVSRAPGRCPSARSTRRSSAAARLHCGIISKSGLRQVVRTAPQTVLQGITVLPMGHSTN